MNLPACTPATLKAVRRFEGFLKSLPQVDIGIQETLHEGVYTRTATVPAGVLLAGCLLKVPTTLVVFGDCAMTTNDKTMKVDGFEVFETPAGRKTLFRTYTETRLVMIFRTNAETIEQARAEFTDDKLMGD